jgi:CHAT domain-containing protein
VVASLVDIHDDETEHLMGHFHAALSTGDSPVGALRAAFKNMRHADRTTTNLTWQSFVVIGHRAALGGAS